MALYRTAVHFKFQSIHNSKIIMQVLKFGGTSVANAENMNKVATIIRDTIKKEAGAVVVSALGGITQLATQHFG